MDKKLKSWKKFHQYLSVREECNSLTVLLLCIEQSGPPSASTAHHEFQSHWRRTGVPFYRFLPSVSVGN